MTPDEARAVIVRILNQIAPETDFDRVDPKRELREQLDIDSIDFLNAAMAIYDETGVDIPEADYLDSKRCRAQPNTSRPGHQRREPAWDSNAQVIHR